VAEAKETHDGRGGVYRLKTGAAPGIPCEAGRPEQARLTEKEMFGGHRLSSSEEHGDTQLTGCLRSREVVFVSRPRRIPDAVEAKLISNESRKQREVSKGWVYGEGGEGGGESGLGVAAIVGEK
jgi:hypothetical protein